MKQHLDSVQSETGSIGDNVNVVQAEGAESIAIHTRLGIGDSCNTAVQLIIVILKHRALGAVELVHQVAGVR